MRVRGTVVATMLLPAVTAMAWPALAGDSSSAATKPKPTCTPNGTALSISARNDTFERDCLAAPAETQFEIAFSNEDHDIHNVSIYDKDHGDRALFKGEVIYGPETITYSVPAQPEGTYQFRCDPHGDSMIGTFVVGSGRPTATSSSTTTSSTTTSIRAPWLGRSTGTVGTGGTGGWARGEGGAEYGRGSGPSR